MNVIQFINKFPLLLEHPVLSDYPITRLFFDKDSQSPFRHELCHFLEREMDKAFLPNFGFKEALGDELIRDDDEYFCNFVMREVRVLSLEKVCPFKIDSYNSISFTPKTQIRINKIFKMNYFKYTYEQNTKHTSSVWWKLFEEKYEALKNRNFELVLI